jgi:CheY-like chemotaxis protein/HPt (histidine-containing phosphotransfer) domain-containing protein
MTMLRVLHVDDEPDIREVVQMALSLDPAFAVQSCPSGGAALTSAAQSPPDIILLDVMMPGMDGPTTLSRLRENPKTADIPVIFMTARAQSRELEHFISLGAEGVIAKPFDPMTLAASVRGHMKAPAEGMAARRENFLKRARINASELARHRAALANFEESATALEQIKSIAHSLAGAGGIFGLIGISSEASIVEDAVIDMQNDASTLEDVKAALDALLARIERE